MIPEILQSRCKRAFSAKRTKVEKINSDFGFLIADIISQPFSFYLQF